MNIENPLPIGIRRIDNPVTRTHSWHVFVQRRGKIVTRHFSDGVHGSTQQSYRAALAFLNETSQSLPRLRRREYADILRKNNASGVPGVSRHCSGRMEYWNARWPTAVGQCKSAKFSVAKYGEERAFELAVAARKAGLANVALDEPYQHRERQQPGRRYAPRSGDGDVARLKRTTWLAHRPAPAAPQGRPTARPGR
jgi:hypothetical protein